MRFDAFEVALEIIRAIRKLMDQVARYDRDLADQMRRAVSSIALNVSEGAKRAGRDRAHSFRVAAGSANEVRAGLLVAEAFGYVTREAIAVGLELIDRELGMLWRLSNPRVP